MVSRKKNPKLKRTIQYLASGKHHEIISSIIFKNPDKVIKSVSEATLKVARGQVSVKSKDKKILSSNRNLMQRIK